MDKKKILLVDDEPDLVEAVQARLEANGYKVLTACDGQEGLAKAQREKPDLIILDIMLPKIDGYSICRLLKFDGKYKQIPIMLFSARNQEVDIKLGEEVGADAYMAKPSESSDFLAKINELLKK